jgi:antitoxin HicB
MSAEPQFESYRLEVRPIESTEGGGFLVALPELEGCMADGATYDEAIANARDAFAAWVSVARSLGREIPAPGAEPPPARFVLRLPRSLHDRAVARAAAEGVSLNTLVTVFVATGLERPAASRRSAPRRKAVG